jgi:hypothetical protein
MTDELMYFVHEAHGQAACTDAQHIIQGLIQCLPVQGFEKNVRIHLDYSARSISKLCNYFFTFFFDFLILSKTVR